MVKKLLQNQTESFGSCIPSILGAYTWSDGTALNFVSWNQGEPTLIGSKGQVEECVEFDRLTGKWNDIDCFSQRGYVCKAAKSKNNFQNSF